MLTRIRPGGPPGRHDWLLSGGKALLLLLIGVSLGSLWAQLQRVAPVLGLDPTSIGRMRWVLVGAELLLLWRISALLRVTSRLYRAARNRPAGETTATDFARGTTIEPVPPGQTPGDRPLD